MVSRSPFHSLHSWCNHLYGDDDPMGIQNWKSITLTLLLSLFIVSNIEIATSETSGDITLEPNVLPDLHVYYDDHTFVFEYKTFFIRIKPFVIYDGQYYGLKQIVSWIKNHYPSVTYKWLVHKALNMIHYGYNLTMLPQEIAENLDFVGFRLVDYNFPLSWFELDEIWMNMQIVTIISIPRANLQFSFEDLMPFGYSIEHVNSTYILIGNVKGRTDLIVDPITMSGDYVTVTGYSEGAECNFTTIYYADLDGTYLLLDDATQGNDQSLTHPIRPADSGALQLTMNVTSYSSPKGDITLNGTDFFDDTLSESIEITGTGLYYSVNNYKTIYSGGIDIAPNIIVDFLQPRWGILSKTANNFVSTALPKIGDGSTETWFADTEVNVLFDCGATRIITIKNNAHFRLGELFDDANKLGIKGCTISTTTVTTGHYIIAPDSTSGIRYMELYDSHFISYNTRTNVHLSTNGKAYNCIFEWVCFGGYFGAEIDTHDITIKKVVGDPVGSNDIAFSRAEGSHERIFIYDCNRAFYYHGSVEVNWTNAVVRNVSYVLMWGSVSGKANMIDFDTDNWNIAWIGGIYAQAHRKYSFGLKFTDDQGKGIENVNVTVSNEYLGSSDSWLTDSSGNIPSQVYSMGYYFNDGFQPYNPYKITAECDGYEVYSTLINITKREDLTIALKEKPSMHSILNDEKEVIVDDDIEVRYKAENGTDTFIEVFRNQTKIIEDNMTLSDVAGLYCYDLGFDVEGQYLIHCFQNHTNPIIEDWITINVRQPHWYEQPLIVMVIVIAIVFIALMYMKFAR